MSAPGFEYFDSTQTGAPGLWGAAGRMAAVLDWVLTGKGGWDTEFTGTNLRVYRSLTGNRFRLRLDDTQAQYSRLRAYRAMTAVSTGTQPFPNTSQSSATTWGVRKSFDTSTTVRPYWGIRTNRYVIIFIENTDELSGGIYSRSPFIFGDVPTLCEADSHATVLIGLDASLNANPYAPSSMAILNVNGATAFPATAVKMGISGTPDGAVVSPTCGVAWPFNLVSILSDERATWAKAGRMHFAPATIWCSDSAASVARAFVRARLPNIQGMPYAIVSGGAVDTANTAILDLAVATVGSRQLKAIAGLANSGSQFAEGCLLEITDTDGAL